MEKFTLILSLFIGLTSISYADQGNQKLSKNTNDFKINLVLCQDDKGPDCSALRLGDDYLTTSTPEIGFLYSCNKKNPKAPGSRQSRITWIDFQKNTWSLFEKLWLPSGKFNPGEGVYSEVLNGNNILVKINSLPVDGKIGDWPMREYELLARVDGNLGIPKRKNMSFVFITEPEEANYPRCVSPGAIGVTKNGVVIFNASDARGEDAVAREITDVFGGGTLLANCTTITLYPRALIINFWMMVIQIL
ncbi:MAG: hypothetical protein ACI8Y9_000494 [Paracoccaceae bacterium]